MPSRFFSVILPKITRMKCYIPLILLAGLVIFGACKEKKESTDIIATKYVPKKPQPPIAMPSDTKTTNVNWQNKPYTVQISREADDSLQLVKDENAQPYVDNRIEVLVMRADGSVFFRRVFTKATFSQYIDESFRKNGILAGIQYDEIDSKGMEFSVVIGLPDAIDDVFVPLELVVDRMGNFTISRDDDMDMLDYGEREDNYDDEGV
jgi:hypothetical protein